MAVEYREIRNFLGYRVGSDGSVWSKWRRGPSGKLGTTWYKLIIIIDTGQPRVRLRREKGCYVHISVAHIVLKSFKGDRPKDLEACHEDGNLRNNRVDNLRWDTHVSNIRDKKLHGTVAKGERVGTSKLSRKSVDEIRKIRNEKGLAYTDLGVMFGISSRQAWRICNNESWVKES